MALLDRDAVLAISLHQPDWYTGTHGALGATEAARARPRSTCRCRRPRAPDTASRSTRSSRRLCAPFRPDLIMVAAGQGPSGFDSTGG
jgi:hypothetical protein